MQNYLYFLGREVQDKVTGFRGIVDSICFDLYGCVQCSVRPRVVVKDGKQEMTDARWHDYHRLTVITGDPVMKQPTFDYDRGPAEKPSLT